MRSIATISQPPETESKTESDKSVIDRVFRTNHILEYDYTLISLQIDISIA